MPEGWPCALLSGRRGRRQGALSGRTNPTSLAPRSKVRRRGQAFPVLGGNIMAKCAFIGLGIMGYPMAGHLVAKGHEVCVYNRNAAKAEAWQKQHGGRTAPRPAGGAEGGGVVFTWGGNG